MIMNISKTLFKLASSFPVPLYVVGGAVRDFLLGRPVGDIDLASSLTPVEVVSFLRSKMPEYKVDTTSPKLGTLKISSNGESYEYTCFRMDSYGSDGNHIPTAVHFVDDIKQDTYRRDFTMNAIYYDIVIKEFIDYSGGIEDLKAKIIKSVRDPDAVLEEDALRIMRLARFAAILDFEIDEKTFESAKKNVDKLTHIAPERLREEFDKIITADTISPNKTAHVRGIKILHELGALEYVLPEILEGINIPQKKEYHKYDVFNHTLKVFELSPPEVRLAALFHDIAKPIQHKSTGSMNDHDKVGEEMVVSRMNALKYPKAMIRNTKLLVRHHMYDLHGKTSDKTLRKFIVKNHDIIEDLIKLKRADWKGSGVLKGESPNALRLEETYNEMKESKVPFTTKELPVNGNDLITIGVPPEARGKALEGLLQIGSYDYKYHSREEALKFLRNFIHG